MSSGFSEEKIEVSIDKDKLQEVLKVYKRIKRYQRSSLFEIKTMDGTETLVSDLLKELDEDG
jgi:hypothetical protein